MEKMHGWLWRNRWFRWGAVIIAAYLLAMLILVWPFLRFVFHPISLLGGEKNYLVLFENNYELRPTGGFISSFAIFTTRYGLPVSLNFEDVYGTVDDHEYVTPPVPLGRLLEHPSYRGQTFRDANVSPDFPTSAAELEKFLRKTRPFQKIDGVFSIDMTFLEHWLDAVGPVGQFDAAHFLEQMEAISADVDLHDTDALATRKSGVKDLFKSLVRRSVLPWNAPAVLRAFKKSFDEKHALAFFHNESLQTIARDLHWDGGLSVPAGEDLLAVVDANYGAAKSNRYVQRSVFYRLDLEAGRGVLDVRYDHPGEYMIPLSTDYRSYLRVYLPQDHGVKKAEFKGEENGLSYAGQTFQMAIRSTHTEHFDVRFPKSVLDQLTYRLNIWKQPGTLGDYYEVAVRVPTGMHVKSGDFEQLENIALFKGFLTRDRRLTFELEKDTLPPRVISQDLSRLNEFDIEWNEPIAPTSMNRSLWSVKDANMKNQKSDTLSIMSLDLNGTKIKVKTAGMTRQPEERYLLEIEGVADFSGNDIKRRSYTFVQRLK